MVTAYADLVGPRETKTNPVDFVIAKPFALETIANALERAHEINKANRKKTEASLVTSEIGPIPALIIYARAAVCRTMRQTIHSHRILVVDDEPTVRDWIEMLLNNDGHEVDAVCSGEQALEKLGIHNYDLVFTDQIMGGMSGEELARAIKIKYPLQTVIMFTAYGEVLDQLTRAGLLLDFTLTKPIDIPLLRVMLLRLTSQKTVKSPARV